MSEFERWRCHLRVEDRSAHLSLSQFFGHLIVETEIGPHPGRQSLENAEVVADPRLDKGADQKGV
jgi:hypothetical protein